MQHADAVDVVPDHGAARVDAQGIGPLESPGAGMGIVDGSEPAVIVEEAEALVGAVVVVADHRTMFVDPRWECSLASRRAGGGDIDGDEPAVAGRAGLDRREHQRCHGKKDGDHASLHVFTSGVIKTDCASVLAHARHGWLLSWPSGRSIPRLHFSLLREPAPPGRFVPHQRLREETRPIARSLPRDPKLLRRRSRFRAATSSAQPARRRRIPRSAPSGVSGVRAQHGRRRRG